MVRNSVVDPDPDADPDSNYLSDADPDVGRDSDFYLMQMRIQIWIRLFTLIQFWIQILASK
jgi:hypothetical protein